jgi:hypothetical protein
MVADKPQEACIRASAEGDDLFSSPLFCLEKPQDERVDGCTPHIGASVDDRIPPWNLLSRLEKCFCVCVRQVTQFQSAQPAATGIVVCLLDNAIFGRIVLLGGGIISK